MKVVIFVDDFSATGVVTNALAIARELVKTGCEVHMLATRADGPMLAGLPSDVKLTALAGNVSGPRKSRMRRAVTGMRAALRRIRPDVLFSAGNQGHLACILAAGAVPGCRTIIRISNDPDRVKDEGLGGPLKRWLRRRKFRLIASRADQIVVVSPHLLKSPALKPATVAAHTSVIPNGVDVEGVRERARAECGHRWLTEDVPVVLAVGRLVEQKNFGTLIDALKIARRTRRLRLVIIGEGPARELLLERARAARVADSVDIAEPVANPIACMARAAVLALPSWREGSSNVLLEAIACNIPVVASRSAGNAADVLGGGRYGVLVDPDDATEMATALLKQTGPDAIRPGERAQDFSRAHALDQYVALITSVGGRACSGAVGSRSPSNS